MGAVLFPLPPYKDARSMTEPRVMLCIDGERLPK